MDSTDQSYASVSKYSIPCYVLKQLMRTSFGLTSGEDTIEYAFDRYKTTRRKVLIRPPALTIIPNSC